MYLGAITSGFLDRSLKEAAGKLQQLGLKSIEIPTGGFFPKLHCNPAELLADAAALESFQQTLSDHQLSISAYAMHGQPLHPDPKIAEAYDREFQETCKLAEKTEVTRMTLIAGLPAAAPGDRTPNWILFPFPPDYVERLKWQWEEQVIPYWREHAKIADGHGIRLCFEMAPADIVYNLESLHRLRTAVGPTVGCNLDPSHLFWQGMDCIEVVRELGDAIYHVHAKDSRVDERIVRTNGVLDPKPFADQARRSWLFRTVGYGHGEEFWRAFISALRLVGYDDVISIEHEDPLIDPDEGFEKAVQFLKTLIIEKPPARLWDTAN